MGLRVFADLKLFDIGATLATDGMFLLQSKPELLTIACSTGIAAMRELKAKLPDTEVLGVTALTTFTDDDSQAMFTCSTDEAVMRLAQLAKEAGIDGLISSAKEAMALRAEFGTLLSLNTPAIRPLWAVVEGDDQNQARVMTPAEAIVAGADRIVIGRPIVESDNPYDATMRTLDEMASVLA
jgi:orotidine-5'-phosphate decarboxylase